MLRASEGRRRRRWMLRLSSKAMLLFGIKGHDVVEMVLCLGDELCFFVLLICSCSTTTTTTIIIHQCMILPAHRCYGFLGFILFSPEFPPLTPLPLHLPQADNSSSEMHTSMSSETTKALHYLYVFAAAVREVLVLCVLRSCSDSAGGMPAIPGCSRQALLALPARPVGACNRLQHCSCPALSTLIIGCHSFSPHESRFPSSNTGCSSFCALSPFLVGM